MGTSDQPRRYKLLAWLAGFVVVVGAVSWLVTRGIGIHVAPTATPGQTPIPLADCPSNDLEVVGVFNECAASAPDAAVICTLSNQGLDDLLRFTGSNQVFGLDIEIDGSFTGAGKYDLPPWPHGMGTRDGVPKVEIEEYSTETIWQSVAGLLTFTSSDGRSGTVNAIFEASNGTSVPPGPTLSVIGPWSCP
ncbi:MAG: hypothetical protein ACHQ4F_10390 [Candidatus Dormibacteria bacterium]